LVIFSLEESTCSAQVVFFQGAQLQLGSGYRSGKLDWNIAGDHRTLEFSRSENNGDGGSSSSRTPLNKVNWRFHSVLLSLGYQF
jgi:hypothetical protein